MTPAVDASAAAAFDAHVTWRDVDPAEAQQMLQADPELRVLDVRTDPEHRMHRLPHSVLVPVQDLPQRLGELDPAARWLVCCEHGRRSLRACSLMTQAGFGDVVNLRGGMAHWLFCGLPVER